MQLISTVDPSACLGSDWLGTSSQRRPFQSAVNREDLRQSRSPYGFLDLFQKFTAAAPVYPVADISPKPKGLGPRWFRRHVGGGRRHPTAAWATRNIGSRLSPSERLAASGCFTPAAASTVGRISTDELATATRRASGNLLGHSNTLGTRNTAVPECALLSLERPLVPGVVAPLSLVNHSRVSSAAPVRGDAT